MKLSKSSPQFPVLWNETPLIHSSRLSQISGALVYLKLENLHPSHSFKYRGISLFAQRAKEVHGPFVHLVAASGGNAGLAAACVANALQVRCSVFLPDGAKESTKDLLRRENARVIVSGRHYEEALQAAQSVVDQEPNAVMVPAYDNEVIWEGHASMIKEISSQLGRKPDALFCSVGGAGLLGGLIVGCKDVGWDDVPIVALETIGSDCFYHSMSLNGGRFDNKDQNLPPGVDVVDDEPHAVRLARFDSFTSKASGSLGASQPSAKVVKMALNRQGGVSCVSVPDELSMQTLVSFTDDHKVLVELACSTTLVPAYKPALFDKLVPARDLNQTRIVVFIVCGGFKVCLEDVVEFRKLVEEDVKKGGLWEVFCDGGVFQVGK